ncbi:hypothetical protein ACMU_09370 [Actibacterium mucosum KCTC 23349]|uniref:AB hydrolase-1 domain-containing protein n=1 Tax=Actibacterium mucosum KCTC 23349 TaxID=1454373 RepID=A0A037ZK19_9RHOB|nr:alpha/beta fold hydrolase [Actibacterium mucosum]KAJ55964.1 hypothetical protein ACMU_09370 [Actibacterium mucosum KCTC 23349]
MRFVLVHGAWCRAVHWGRVPALLRQAGHDVLAIDLPDSPAADITLDAYANAILDATIKGDLLVGHSMGGMAISAAAARDPERFPHMVYVAAFLPEDGQSLIDIKKSDSRSLIDSVQVEDAHSTRLIAAKAGGELMHDAPQDLVDWAAAQLRAQPNRPQTDPFSMHDPRFRLIPKTFVQCLNDRVITPAKQAAMSGAAPICTTIPIPTGHFPQLSHPQMLSDILLSIHTELH